MIFCDEVTDSIQQLINITEYRRARQIDYNEAHGITPESVIRPVQESLSQATKYAEEADKLNRSVLNEDETTYNATQVIAELEEEMREAAAKLEFERAAHLRDQIKQLQNESVS